MNELFGIPLDTLLLILATGLGVAFGILAVLAARNPVLKFTRPRWKFPLQPVTKLRRFSHFIQAAPVFRARFRMRARWRNRFHL